jgi:hypothetical protein
VARYITTVSAWRSRSRREPLVVLGLRQVHRRKCSRPAKRSNSSARGAWRTSTLSKRDWISSRYCVVAQVVARDADDAAAGGQAAVAEGLEQRGHQLAPGQVAGAAEKNEVEAHGGTSVEGSQLDCNLVSCFLERAHAPIWQARPRMVFTPNRKKARG